MRDNPTFTINSKITQNTLIDRDTYEAMYHESIEKPEVFWEKQAEALLNWITPWESIIEQDDQSKTAVWFKGGKINACYNLLDRHLEKNADKLALIWECDDQYIEKKLTYGELHKLVCRFANVLKSRGVKKGDRVCIYMPMIAEAAVAMLACMRIGAVHCVVFGGFSSDMLSQRINDAGCKIIITADEIIRGGKHYPMKENVEKAIKHCAKIHTTIIIQRTGTAIPQNIERDIWYHDAMVHASSECPCEEMDAEDPLFIIYTSGSNGDAKGIVHSTAGYLLFSAISFKYVFDYQDDEVFWCSADMGWITGHTYSLYGPLLNAATTLMFEGVPSFPSYHRYWQIIDKHKVNIFYTAPTVIRTLMAQDQSYTKGHSLKSLRILASVGEPINSDAWEWFYNEIGNKKCTLLDTWWQSETGGICITPHVSFPELKAGSAGRPFFGIEPVIIDQQGNSLDKNTRGLLAIKNHWPGKMQTIYGDHDRYLQSYYHNPSGYYMTGDGAYIDDDGDFWLTGRVDDFINVSGHRLNTMIIENALSQHEAVADVAVVGYPHGIKGQGVYAFVLLKSDFSPKSSLKNELMSIVIDKIGAIARPDIIQWCEALPKTSAGKVLRPILRKIVANEINKETDLSELNNPDIVEDLIAGAKKIQTSQSS